MTKLKEFKEIATNVGVVLKKYWFFRTNRNVYLEQKNITDKEVDKIIEDLKINFSWTVKDEHDQELKDDGSKIFHNILLVDSFYNNHNLFKYLVGKLNIEYSHVHLQFRTKIFVNNLNDTTPKLDIEEVKKSIKFMNNKEINLLVLEKAISSNNKELYNAIMQEFNWKNDENSILHSIFSSVSNYGLKIKDKLLTEEIKKHINVENITYFVSDMLRFPKNKEKNVNDFFGINVLEYIAKDESRYNKFNLGVLSDSHKEVKKFLNGLNREQDYTKVIFQYIEKEYEKTDIVDKFKFLIKENLLNEKNWEKLINKDYKNFLGNIFDNYEKLEPILGHVKIMQVMRVYKHIIVNEYIDDKRYNKFIETYPDKLTDEELLTIIGKRFVGVSFTTPLEKQAIELVKEKYAEQLSISTDLAEEYNVSVEKIKLKEKVWLDVLYDNYPDFMNNKDNLLKVLKVTNNDVFVSMYLKRYFTENSHENTVGLKKETLKYLQVFNSQNISNTLEWIIENDLLKELIPNFNDMPINVFTNINHNHWVPLLVEKYNVKPDIIIRNTVASFMSNDELFKFILNNYNLDPRTEQMVCNSVYSIGNVELATELLKKGIVINDYYEEKFKNSPTESGNILLKAKLKNKLETKFEENEIKKPKEKTRKI